VKGVSEVTIQKSTIAVELPQCEWCNKAPETMELDAEKVQRWQRGELLQNVFPELPAEEREMLISGTHPKCWDNMWKDME